VIDEISSINKKILKFIDLLLKSIKCIPTKFFWNLDIIIVEYFYQVQPICDTRIFKNNINNIDNLDSNFWMEKIKCIETRDAPKWWKIHQHCKLFLNCYTITNYCAYLN
jgi:hypothetical protein